MFSFLCVLVYIALTAKNFHCASVLNQESKVIYTPSISELSVPLRENPKIILENFPGKSVTLPLLNGLASATNYYVHLARQAGNSDPGHFIVEAPKGHGVMAVIQQLHLRRISDSHSLLQLVNNCKDYLMFESNREKTSLICGSIEKGDSNFYPQHLNGPKFFNSPDGRIKVIFRNHYSYYGNELIAPQNDSSSVKTNQEMITAEVTFTAYSKCETADQIRGNFQCTDEKCIDSSLVCDNVVNCSPGENQRHFGVDETNCTVPIHDHKSHDIEPKNDDQDESKPPRMTTILILVAALILITICGYFWSWLSQLCCVARSLFKSGEVGVQQQQQVSVFSTTTPRLPVAYYVPAVILRSASSRNSLNSTNNNISTISQNSLTPDTCLKSDDSDSPPPSYDLLFGTSSSGSTSK